MFPSGACGGIGEGTCPDSVTRSALSHRSNSVLSLGMETSKRNFSNSVTGLPCVHEVAAGEDQRMDSRAGSSGPCILPKYCIVCIEVK